MVVKLPGWIQFAWRSWSRTFALLHCAARGGCAAKLASIHMAFLVVHLCDVGLCRLWWLSRQVGFNPHGVLGCARVLCETVPSLLVQPPGWLQSAWCSWSRTFALLHCAARRGPCRQDGFNPHGVLGRARMLC